MAGENYTQSEVEWLLSMSYADALACDTAPPDSWPDLLAEGAGLGHTGGPGEDSQLLVVLRWHDVHNVRRRVQDDLDAQLTELRRRGHTEAQIAEMLGSSQQTVSRRLRASVRDIVGELAKRAA